MTSKERKEATKGGDVDQEDAEGGIGIGRGKRGYRRKEDGMGKKERRKDGQVRKG